MICGGEHSHQRPQLWQQETLVWHTISDNAESYNGNTTCFTADIYFMLHASKAWQYTYHDGNEE
jgi:hypothetical protein